LNCNANDAGSVCNANDVHGSIYGAESIWNQFGDYGSPFSDHSPWNLYASNPPIIVDRDGNSYGYFTKNRFASDRTQIRILVSFLDAVDASQLSSARDLFCG